MKTGNNDDPKPNTALAWYSYIVVTSVLFLLYMGAFTTTIKAGMVFPDWPLSNGSINPDGWLTNQAMFAEHSHRLLGATVGILCIGLVVWLACKEPRRWVRRLGYLGLGMVVIQGLLGGKRVLFNSVLFAGMHGFLAHAVLCVLATVAIAQSSLWRSVSVNTAPHEQRSAERLGRWGIAITTLLFVQLLVAVVMRHMDAGLAIRTFPLSEGGALFPHNWTPGVALHFAHRVVAGILFIVILTWTWAIVAHDRTAIAVKLLACFNILLLLVQIGLGAATIWLERLPVPTTMHVLNGAVLLSTSWTLTFSFFKLRLHSNPAFAEVKAHEPHLNEIAARLRPASAKS